MNSTIPQIRDSIGFCGQDVSQRGIHCFQFTFDGFNSLWLDTVIGCDNDNYKISSPSAVLPESGESFMAGCPQ